MKEMLGCLKAKIDTLTESEIYLFFPFFDVKIHNRFSLIFPLLYFFGLSHLINGIFFKFKNKSCVYIFLGT